MADIQLVNAAKAFKGLPHQISAFNWLQEQLTSQPELLSQFAEMYRADPPIKSQLTKLLRVPYEYQIDNSSGTGFRECFSSSCAMLARFYGVNIASDNDYNRIRARYGDSTDANAQIKALNALGLIASFHQNGTPQILEKYLCEGKPVAVGWLHKGPVSKPYGGHWTVIVGYDPDAFIHNDPYGEADMVNGGYVSTLSTAGRGIRYSRANWLPRWCADGPGSGWFLTASKP